MNVRKEIAQHAAPEDRECLIWLFGRYHWSSQWGFVARCTMKRYGHRSYECNRIWTPTVEGRVLFAHREEVQPCS